MRILQAARDGLEYSTRPDSVDGKPSFETLGHESSEFWDASLGVRAAGVAPPLRVCYVRSSSRSSSHLPVAQP